jgi:hypothetical protein
MAKAYGCFQVDPNHFFSQLLNIIYFTTIYLTVNGTVEKQNETQIKSRIGNGNTGCFGAVRVCMGV